MHALDHQETGTCIFIYFSECGRIKFGWIPIAQHFLVTHFRRMTIFFKMIFVGLIVQAYRDYVHTSRHFRRQIADQNEPRYQTLPRGAMPVRRDNSSRWIPMLAQTARGQLEYPASFREMFSSRPLSHCLLVALPELQEMEEANLNRLLILF